MTQIPFLSTLLASFTRTWLSKDTWPFEERFCPLLLLCQFVQCNLIRTKLEPMLLKNYIFLLTMTILFFQFTLNHSRLEFQVIYSIGDVGKDRNSSQWEPSWFKIGLVFTLLGFSLAWFFADRYTFPRGLRPLLTHCEKSVPDVSKMLIF